MAPRTIPTPLRGVTIDNASGAGRRKIATYIESLSTLPHKATVRLVFDPGEPPSAYRPTVNALRDNGHYVIGELADSTALKNYTVASYKTQVSKFLDEFGDDLDGYEEGNENNGNWLGPYPDVAAKIAAAHQLISAAGQTSVLTPWYNDQCGNGPSELSPEAWAPKYLTAEHRADIDYVLTSYYETQCQNRRPTAAQWTAYFQRMRTLYPNAKQGFGEIGLPRPVTATTLQRATSMANYYYKMRLPTLSYYVGGIFWWYWAQDGTYDDEPMHEVIRLAMA